MKMLFKRTISYLLAIALVFSGLCFTHVTKGADYSDWEMTAIKAPVEGQLVGAGYIVVSFDNSISGKTFKVFLDGKDVLWEGNDIVSNKFEKATDGAKAKVWNTGSGVKTEVYTTEVGKHKIEVKAMEGDNIVASAQREFFVSKKGLAMGDNMGDKITLNKLNCSWYYNWSTKAFNNTVDQNVEHIPMMWGGGEDNIEAMKTLVTSSNYFLGFNEPDIVSQANMGFYDAVDVWKQCISPLNMRKVSPAPAAPGGDSKWLECFMNGDYICKDPEGNWGRYYDYGDDATKTWKAGLADDVDAVCLHYYRNFINLQGMKDAIDTLWNTYHKPIWITEISLFGMKGYETDMSYEKVEKRHEIEQYVSDMIDILDKDQRVERYCWFPYDIDSTNDIDRYDGSGGTALFEYASGFYTELGRIYGSKGNPEGYKAQTISNEEMYVNVTVETTAPEITKVAPTKKKVISTTKSKVAKPGKVKLTKAKNVKKKSVSLTWKKVKGANKYNVQYAFNKKFTKKVKIKTTTKTNFKLKKLTKKKTYYLRVRAINSSGSGAWSNVKKVKVKK